MAHLTDGALRRMHDEALAVTGAARRHFDGCDSCRARYASIGDGALQAAALFQLPELEVDAQDALSALRPRLPVRQELGPLARLRGSLWNWQPRTIRRPLLVGLVAAALVVAVAGTSVAQQALQIFEGSNVTPVAVKATDFQGLPDLSGYGTYTQTKPNFTSVATAAEASASAGLTLVSLPSLPDGVTGTPRYAVMQQTTESFTFSAQKARDEAVRTGKPVPAMPKGIDGSTISVTIGPAVAQIYGGPVEPTPGDSSSPNSPAAAGSRLPSLVIGQSKAPMVTSTGVTVKQLEDYLLSQPGISSHLAAQIRAIGDPATTLPLPIPEQATSKTVTVQGVSGVYVGDNTGIGSGVIWARNGMLYAVAGPLKEAQVLTIANSLR